MQADATQRSLFILTLTYIKPLTEVERLLEAHRSYLMRNYERGIFLMSGAQKPRVGGFILARAESREQIANLIQDDPFLKEDVARYEIMECLPSRFAAGLEHILA
jgi:uncharacterized protein YciI